MPDRHRYTLPVPPDHAESRAALLLAAGAVGIWQRPRELVAWFAAEVDLPDAVGGGRFTLEPDRDWQAEWKATIGPVHAGGFVIVPTWLADDHHPRSDETTLVLDPGRAFGSGHHATTTLCLELLDALDLDGVDVLDVGCGSGVLAIAAAARGARAAGCDVDPEAVTVTRENATRNDVAVPVAEGSVAAGSELLGAPAGVVVANLVTDTIVALAADLVAALAPGGVLLASGITSERQDVATSALTAAGLVVDVTRERDGWVGTRARRPDRPGSPVAPIGPAA